MSSSTTNDNNRQSLTASLPIHTDLSTIHHRCTSPEPGRRHGQGWCISRARQGSTIRGREFVQGAEHIPDCVKGTSGTAPAVSAVLEPRLIAAPQHQEPFAPPCFTFGSGSPPNTEDLANAFTSTFNGLSLGDDHPSSNATAVEAASSDTGASPTSDVLGPSIVVAPQQQGSFAPPCFTLNSRSPPNAEPGQQAMDSYKLSQRDYLANAFSSAFKGLSLRNDHPSSSATVVEVPSSDTAPSDILGPPLIATPQQQVAFVPPCFTFSSGSHPNVEAEQQAMDCYKPSQCDDLANAISSAFDGLSLGNDQPGPSATAVEAASSGTGSSSHQGGGRQEQ